MSGFDIFSGLDDDTMEQLGIDNERNDNEGTDNEGIDNEGTDNEGTDNEGTDDEGTDNEGTDNEGMDLRTDEKLEENSRKKKSQAGRMTPKDREKLFDFILDKIASEQNWDEFENEKLILFDFRSDKNFWLKVEDSATFDESFQRFSPPLGPIPADYERTFFTVYLVRGFNKVEIPIMEFVHDAPKSGFGKDTFKARVMNKNRYKVRKESEISENERL